MAVGSYDEALRHRQELVKDSDTSLFATICDCASVQFENKRVDKCQELLALGQTVVSKNLARSDLSSDETAHWLQSQIRIFLSLGDIAYELKKPNEMMATILQAEELLSQLTDASFREGMGIAITFEKAAASWSLGDAAMVILIPIVSDGAGELSG